MATSLGRCAYGRATDTTPHHRAWDGTDFGAELDLNVANSNILWMVIKSNPDDAVEKAVAFWADNLTGDNFWVMTWNGSSWTTGFSGRFAESQVSRGFDLEYENGGDILVIYSDETTQLKYRLRASGTWGSEQNAGTTIDSNPRTIVIKRANDTDTLFTAISSDGGQLHAKRWTGSAIDNDTRIDDGSNVLAVKEQQCFDISFEGNNNNCFVIFGDTNKDLEYRLFTTSWSGITQAYSGMSDKVFELRADWDHDSGQDDIAVVMVLGNGFYEFASWNGSSWQTRGSTLAAQNKNERGIGIQFERSTTGTAVAVMCDKDDNIPLSYRTLTVPATWSSVSTLARSGGATINALVLNADDASDDMIVMISDQDDDLDSAKWTGTTFGDLEANLAADLPSSSKLEPFGFAWNIGVAPVAGAKRFPSIPRSLRY